MVSHDRKKKGVRVKKGQSALEALQNAVPHWIHHTREDSTSVSGVFYLPQCDCSECGYTVSFERPYCPHCGVKMEKMKGI